MNQRDAEILTRYEGGATLAAIGRDYGLTRERVRQIVARHGLAPRKPVILAAAREREERRRLERQGRKELALRSARQGTAFRIERNLLAQLGESAKALGISRSELLRRCLEDGRAHDNLSDMGVDGDGLNIGIRLPRDLLDAIATAAEQARVTRSAIIRRWLRRGLANVKLEPAP